MGGMDQAMGSMGAPSSDNQGAFVHANPLLDPVPDHLVSELPADADVVAQAPARANLIGEHTDYNDGFVLPAAIHLRTVVGGRRADTIRLRAIGHQDVALVSPSSGDGPTEGWGRYVVAVVRALLDDGRAVLGLDGVVASDIPAGAGLSSSAALEVALVLALLDEPPDPVDLARICRRAENAYVGVGSGIMDPLASAGCTAGSAMLIDCRSLDRRPVAVPDGLALLIVDGGERRELASGAYDRRRAECAEAARLLGVTSLRDATVAQLGRAALPEPLASRARHVVSENARTLAAVEALEADDRSALGELFAASHQSLARDFAVTTPALDALVEVALATPGVVASRMTGAGFGGCTVGLVERDEAESARTRILAEYAALTGRQARGWISAASPGALSLAPRSV
jgi:galactokinase